ncbi:MAG: cytochrome c family protein [Pseudomonadota bacterium]
MKLSKFGAAATAVAALTLAAAGVYAHDHEPAEKAAAGAEAAATDAAEAVGGMADKAKAATDTETATTEAADAVGGMADAAKTAAGDAADTAVEAAAGAVGAAGAAATGAVQAAASAFSNSFTTASGDTISGDTAAGAKVFNRCRACHVIEEGENRQGPSLHGVIGRTAGAIEDFRYSDANANSGVTWDEATLFEYLENPRTFMPGTRMAFAGLRNPQDRADVIAYIAQESGAAAE